MSMLTDGGFPISASQCPAQGLPVAVSDQDMSDPFLTFLRFHSLSPLFPKSTVPFPDAPAVLPLSRVSSVVQEHLRCPLGFPVYLAVNDPWGPPKQAPLKISTAKHGIVVFTSYSDEKQQKISRQLKINLMDNIAFFC